jgi:GDP-D-mannose 3',5'-epimerase
MAITKSTKGEAMTMHDIDTFYVTGVAGMIGSNLARALVERGVRVVGVDNLWRGTRDNIADLLPSQHFSFRHADIAADMDWFRDIGPRSALIHTADIVAGIGYVFAHEWNVFQKNNLINTQIARLVNQQQPARLIYLGTACSYPQGLQRSVQTSVLSESVKFPAYPESGYGWSKLIGEIELRLAVKGTATRFAVLDLHNVYGWPCVYRDSTAQVIPSLVNRALSATDRKLTVWGNGQQGRAFVHTSDVVAAVLAALNYDGDESTFMIGPDQCTTIGEVAQLIQAHPKVRIDEIVFDSSKPTGDIGRFADASRAKRELGWTPQVWFEDGLHDLIDRIVADRAARS